ncbi:MAG: TonB-dependent receptor [Ignavibacteria bacterium]|nr:TonB-dependent receptor [Ignavibacteria bacterium]
MQKISLLVLLVVLAWYARAEGPPFFIGRITGTVTDGSTGEPLPGVNILIPSLKRGTSTDIDGKFIIDRLHEGAYTITFSFLGYAPESRTVILDDRDVDISVRLYSSVLSFPTVTVTSRPQARELLLSTQSTSVLDETELLKKRSQTLTESISHLPGVHGLSTGVSIAKPVIRGLAGPRVLVMKDGIRQEGQQWGDEHAPEIDIFHVERVEVVRGPGSLLYGSDALGGVVNVISPHVPASPEGSRSLQASLAMNYFSNNRQGSGSAGLKGSEGKLGYQANLSLRDAGNYRSADGLVEGTSFHELNGAIALGYHADNWYVEGALDRFASELDIYQPDAPDANDEHGGGNQAIEHLRWNIQSSVILEGVRLVGHVAAQTNIREEFEKEEESGHAHGGEPAIQLRTNTYEFDLKGHHRPFWKFTGTLGFSYLHQDVVSKGEDKLVPNSEMNDLALFVFEELLLDNFTLSGGLRYDFRRLMARDNGSFPGVDGRHKFRALSVSVGFSWLVQPNFSAVFGVARGWRAPIPFELYADGVHHGTSTYYVGKEDLQPELSTSHDISLRYSSAKTKAEITGYVNLIFDYMYPSPTGVLDAETGYPIKEYRSAQRAQIHGLEVSLESEILPWLRGDLTGDITIGKNLDRSHSLPFIPPASIRLGLTGLGDSMGVFGRPYVGFQLTRAFPQSRVAEGESPSEGYFLLGVHAGAQFTLGSSVLAVSLAVENALDVRYTDHLSRLKPFGVSNPGRNIIVRTHLPIAVFN